MIHRPWRDVPSTRYWSVARLAELEKDRKTRWAGAKNHRAGPLLRQRSIGDAAGDIERELTEYHNLPKDQLGMFGPRVHRLRHLSTLADDFLTAYRWSQESQAYRTKNHADAVQELPRLAATIRSRGAAKAAYLEALVQFYEGARQGNTNRSLIDLLKPEQLRTRTQLGLKPGVRLEMADPFHRNFEGHLGGDEGAYTFGGVPSQVGAAFGEWLEEFNAAPNAVPHFFVWLEGHIVCTDGRIKSVAKEVAGITYGAENMSRQTWCKLLVPGSFPVEWTNPDFVGPSEVAHTPTHSTGRGKAWTDYTLPGEAQVDLQGVAAFVWDTTDTIFVFAHMEGKQHHSSGNEGGTVKAAGNIYIRGGAIEYVDGNSGHYAPSEEHIRNFCIYLEKRHGLRNDAVISYYDANTGLFIPARWGAYKTGASIAVWQRRSVTRR